MSHTTAVTQKTERQMTSYTLTKEILDPELDDGTMPMNVEELSDAVVGHRIVSAEKLGDSFKIILDNDKAVWLKNTDDCCAFTYLDSFLLNVENIEHVITGVGTTESYEKWHIYADLGDVLELSVNWSSGNPFYYGYGFNIAVVEGETE